MCEAKEIFATGKPQYLFAVAFQIKDENGNVITKQYAAVNHNLDRNTEVGDEFHLYGAVDYRYLEEFPDVNESCAWTFEILDSVIIDSTNGSILTWDGECYRFWTI